MRAPSWARNEDGVGGHAVAAQDGVGGLDVVPVGLAAALEGEPEEFTEEVGAVAGFVAGGGLDDKVAAAAHVALEGGAVSGGDGDASGDGDDALGVEVVEAG